MLGEIRRRPLTAAGPVLARLGLSDLSERRAPADAAEPDFVVKPIDCDILQARMRNVLTVSSPGAAPAAGV